MFIPPPLPPDELPGDMRTPAMPTLAGDKGEPSDTRSGDKAVVADNTTDGAMLLLVLLVLLVKDDDDVAPAPPVENNDVFSDDPPGEEPLPPAARKADSKLPTPLIAKKD